ncbi:MAG: serine--tRNA ligase [Nannocystaceae bacterium]|nr:serine--tRNA ligase [bacterium]
MLDIKLLRTEPDLLVSTLRDRGVRLFEDLTEGDWARASVDRLAELDGQYRSLLQEEESIRREMNENATAMKAVGKLPKEEQAAARTPLIEAGRVLREREKDIKVKAEAAMNARDEAWGHMPNITHPDAPRGHTDDDHRTTHTWGTPRDFESEGFAARDHLQIAEDLDLVDFAAGSKVVGAKFYYLKNDAVLLDLALQRFALDIAAKHGFTLHITPDLARVDILQGLGFNPRGESTQVYSIADSDLCLVGTAEITLGGMFADSILDREELPILVAGLSHCFRTEAGAAGKESRGLYRVHQFTKVELFAFVEGDLEVSEAMHERMRDIEEEIFQKLELPYRVLDIASGDLGGPAYRKYDIEAWMPGRGEYGEVTSTSNCTDYQARRLRVRYRTEAPADGKKSKGKNRFVHMLNGTAIANTRTILAVLENHQQEDGTVRVPEALRPYFGKDAISRR